MGIHSDWNRGREQRSSVESWCQPDNGDGNSCNGYNRSNRRGNRRHDKFLRLIRSIKRRNVYNLRSRRQFPIFPDIFWTRYDQSDDNTKSHHSPVRNRRNKYVYPIIAAFLSVQCLPLKAESVGGVSATANPIANSSGSVTNQAIQVLQGPYITNTYGNQISCQGPTFNATPYIQYSNSWKDPFERTYMQPQYNNTDFTGRTTTQTITVKNYPWEDWYDDRVRTDPNDPKYDVDEDGNPDRWWNDGDDMQIEVEVDGPDGIPDNPGDVVWEKPVRTDMSANNNFNLGLSATLSLPLDKKLQKLCKEAASVQIGMQRQLTANKRLDFEIARLKNCGELMQAGIMFHPKSPYASICADVVLVQPPGKLAPHSHNLPRPRFEETVSPSPQPSSSSQPESAASQNLSPTSPSSPDNDSSESQPESDDKESSQASSGWLRWPFSRQASQPSEVDQPAALLGGPIQLPPSRSLP